MILLFNINFLNFPFFILFHYYLPTPMFFWSYCTWLFSPSPSQMITYFPVSTFCSAFYFHPLCPTMHLAFVSFIPKACLLKSHSLLDPPMYPGQQLLDSSYIQVLRTHPFFNLTISKSSL